MTWQWPGAKIGTAVVKGCEPLDPSRNGGFGGSMVDNKSHACSCAAHRVQEEILDRLAYDPGPSAGVRGRYHSKCHDPSKAFVPLPRVHRGVWGWPRL